MEFHDRRTGEVHSIGTSSAANPKLADPKAVTKRDLQKVAKANSGAKARQGNEDAKGVINDNKAELSAKVLTNPEVRAKDLKPEDGLVVRGSALANARKGGEMRLNDGR